MKRTIKVLAALLSLLVLGTTLSVPVTAVGSDDSVSPFVLDATTYCYYEDFSLFDPDEGFEALTGYGSAYYIDRIKKFIVTTHAYAYDGVTEEQYQRFSASINVYYYHNYSSLDYPVSEVLYSSELFDHLNPNTNDTLDPQIFKVFAASDAYWATPSNLWGCSGTYFAGSDFIY